MLKAPLSPAGCAVAGLAAFRLTRLIVVDTIWESTRRKLTDWLKARDALWGDKMAELIGCSHCTGVWVSAGVYAALAHHDGKGVLTTDPARSSRRVAMHLAGILAVAGVVSLLSSLEPGQDEEHARQEALVYGTQAAKEMPAALNEIADLIAGFARHG